MSRFDEAYQNWVAKADKQYESFTNPSEKPQSAVEFIENSSKTAKIEINQVKTAKWSSDSGKFGSYKTAGEHLDELRGSEVPQTTKEKMRAWRKGHADSTPNPNAAFARMKRDEFCKRLSTPEEEIPNKEDNLAMAKVMVEEIENADDEYDNVMDEWEDELWSEDD